MNNHTEVETTKQTNAVDPWPQEAQAIMVFIAIALILALGWWLIGRRVDRDIAAFHKACPDGPCPLCGAQVHYYYGFGRLHVGPCLKEQQERKIRELTLEKLQAEKACRK
jgi:hypothetical protein